MGKAMFTEKEKEEIDKIIEKYKDDPGPLISILQELQSIFGYLPKEALFYISEKLKIPESRIWETVTFYTQFYLEPRGKNTIRVCIGTACHVKGSSRVLERLQKKLGIKPGETTLDYTFSLETVRCLGTCFLAPVIMINSDYFGNMTPDKVERAVARYKEE